MLKQRVITALFLALIFGAALFGLSPEYFAFFVAVVVIICAWEWSNLSGLSQLWQRLLFSGFILGLLVWISQYISFQNEPGSSLDIAATQEVLLVACLWWAIGLLFIQSYPSSSVLWGHKGLRLLIGGVVLVPTWVALVYLRQAPQGAWLVLMLMLIVAVADTGGYFVGRRFGKYKLAPAVSPGKTWEGFAGGLIANLILAAILSNYLNKSVLSVIAVTLPTSLASVLGDLFESMMKRHAGVKDSGSILPGHGGILDRIDGVTASAPVFALALLLSGIFANGALG